MMTKAQVADRFEKVAKLIATAKAEVEKIDMGGFTDPQYYSHRLGELLSCDDHEAGILPYIARLREEIKAGKTRF